MVPENKAAGMPPPGMNRRDGPHPSLILPFRWR